MTIYISEDKLKQDISLRAVKIARMIDRLPPGSFTIQLKLPESDSERWTIEVLQQVTVIQKRDIVDGA